MYILNEFFGQYLERCLANLAEPDEHLSDICEKLPETVSHTLAVTFEKDIWGQMRGKAKVQALSFKVGKGQRSKTSVTSKGKNILEE